MSNNAFIRNHNSSSEQNHQDDQQAVSSFAHGGATPLTRFIDLLKEKECFPSQSGGGWSSLCPAHDDNNPSLSISEAADGKVLLHCHAGCEVDAIVETLGLTIADLFPAKKPRNSNGGQIVKTYDYLDECGNFLFQVCRYEPKGFRQRRADGASGWTWSVKGVRRVLYRLAEVVNAVQRGEVIYVCEGEKDVEAMEAHGFVATCNSGGAGKWHDEYNEFLRGADLIIIADKDEAGRKHAKLVSQKLSGIANSVRTVDLPDRDGKPVKDASDWFAAGGVAEELVAIIDATMIAGAQTAAGQFGQVGQVLATPSRENSDSADVGGQDKSGQPGQDGQTPATWFQEKYPTLTSEYGDAVLEKIEKNGIITVRDINEDFLASTLGSKGTPDAPTVFVAAEDKFYKYSQSDGIYVHQREPVLQALLSKQLLECARDCRDECETQSLAFRFRDTSKLSGVIKRARGLLEVPPDYFAADLTDYILCANGVLRLDDKELLTFSPEYRRRNKLAVAYDPAAECPLFLDTLMRPALDDVDLEFLQRWCGLALLGENLAQKILILTGTAGGGKGTFIRVLVGVIGAMNMGSLRTQLLGERFELSRFLGKTLLYGADVPEDFLNQRGASVLKSLTGYDPVTLEFKNSNESPSIICKFNVVVTCNSRLTVHLEGDNEAWRRRLAVIEYTRPKTKNVIADLDKLILAQEGAGVLNWMLAGLDKIRADGWQLRVGEDQQGIVDSLLLESDGHAVFVRESLIRDADGQVLLSACYQAYVTFCAQRHWTALTQIKFGKVIGDTVVRQFGLTQRHDLRDALGKLQRGWKGISLVVDSAEPSGENLSDPSGGRLTMKSPPQSPNPGQLIGKELA